MNVARELQVADPTFMLPFTTPIEMLIGFANRVKCAKLCRTPTPDDSERDSIVDRLSEYLGARNRACEA
jgi:hypothetical protein